MRAVLSAIGLPAASALALLAALVLASSLAAPARSATRSSCPPPSEVPAGQPVAEKPANAPQEVVVACVASEPLTEATFLHWRTIAAVAGASENTHRRPNAQAVIEQTMGFLLSADWVLGEARSLNIRISAAAVERQFETIRKQQFPREQDFVSFLKRTKQTRADLLMRVELDMLSMRMQRKVTEGRRGPRAQTHALSRFVRRFRNKWTAQTYCAPAYAVKDCGHVQTNL